MNLVPATHGLQWLRIGWLLFMRNPLVWMLSFAALVVLEKLFMEIPVVGTSLMTLIMPAFSAGFLSMAEAAEKNRPIEPGLLFAGFRQKAVPLLGLGGAYLIAGALIILIGDFLSPTPVPDATQLTQIEVAVIALTFFLSVLLHLAFWFAPALVLWRDMSPLKAVFFSFFACWRNWRALLMYCMTVGIFLTGALLLFSLLMALFFGDQMPPEETLRNLLQAFSLGLAPMLLASFYVSYRDVFGSLEKTAEPT